MKKINTAKAKEAFSGLLTQFKKDELYKNKTESALQGDYADFYEEAQFYCQNRVMTSQPQALAKKEIYLALLVAQEEGRPLSNLIKGNPQAFCNDYLRRRKLLSRQFTGLESLIISFLIGGLILVFYGLLIAGYAWFNGASFKEGFVWQAPIYIIAMLASIIFLTAAYYYLRKGFVKSSFSESVRNPNHWQYLATFGVYILLSILANPMALIVGIGVIYLEAWLYILIGGLFLLATFIAYQFYLYYLLVIQPLPREEWAKVEAEPYEDDRLLPSLYHLNQK